MTDSFKAQAVIEIESHSMGEAARELDNIEAYGAGGREIDVDVQSIEKLDDESTDTDN